MKKKVSCAVYGCGLSASGALAIPRLTDPKNVVTATEARKPARITHFNIRDITRVSAGFGFSLFASKDKLYGSGLNNRFQITSHLSTVAVTPSQEAYMSAKRIALPTASRIISISCGRAHSLVATIDGVYAFGDNCHGQCGQNPDVASSVYGTVDVSLGKIDIPSDSPVISVHCALDTSFILTSAGEVFAFGLNEDGQCSNGKYGIQWTPSRIIGDAAQVRIASLSGSSDTLLATSKDGDVFVWGQCEYGQAGEGNRGIQMSVSRRLPFSMGRVTSTGTSAAACLASNDKGEVYVWGVGVLGMGPSSQRLARPMLMDQPLFDNNKVIRVIGGNTAMAAINDQGCLFVWGQNRFGLLGLGHEKDQFFPYQVYLPNDVRDVSIGPDHSLFLVK